MPVELDGSKGITSSKELEWKQSGNTILLDIMSTPEQLNSEKKNEHEEHRYEKAFETREGYDQQSLN